MDEEAAWWADPVWWTAAGTVVLAIATLVLAAAAIAAGVMAVKAFRKQSALVDIERLRDLQREDTNKRIDASRIAAWTVYKGPDDSDWVAMIRNPSNLPIYDVKLAWKCGEVLMGVAPSGFEQEVGIVTPREVPQEIHIEGRFAADVDDLQKMIWASEGGPSRFPVTVRLFFRDAAGEEWVREWDGKLVHASQASDPLASMERLRHARRRSTSS